MRKLLLIAALVMVFTPLVSAQEYSITLADPSGVNNEGQIEIGSTVLFPLEFNIDGSIGGGRLAGFSNAFHIYSPGNGNAAWENIVPYFDSTWVDNPPFFVVADSVYRPTGSGADTISFSAASIGSGIQVPAEGFSDTVLFIQVDIPNNPELHNTVICLDSVPTFDPTNNWVWSDGAIPGNDLFPTFSGAHCYTIIDPNAPTNQAPIIESQADTSVTEGETLEFTVNATDPDGTIPALSAPSIPDGASFSDNGDGSGTFSWATEAGDAGTYEAIFAATDGEATVEDTVQITVDPAPTARLQIIHNAADPAAALVDIWVNGVVYKEDVAFRTATPFEDVPAGVELTIGVSAPNSTDILRTFSATLTENTGYVLIANGVLDTTQFQSNPDGRSADFTLFQLADAREAGENAPDVDFVALHGVTDAPTVDVVARGLTTLVDNAAYGDITPYINVPATSYTLDVTLGDNNDAIVASFAADLTGLDGGAAVVFASGFLTPGDDQNGEAFGLFAALPTGTVVEFPPLNRLIADPTELAFSAVSGGGATAADVLTVTEQFGRNIDFALANGSSWLVLSATDGTTPATIDVSADPAGLTPNVYADTIVITATDADNDVRVPVTFTVTEAPSFVLTPDTLYFEGEEGGANPPAQTALIESEGDDVLVDISPLAAYISADPTTLTTPDSTSIS
ncbi:DUF4397 domain-containing protein, partial [candidate division GN15 bacterium]|nr:DUF4397 domain-containing protein [candidate division GN15 bacterium]